MTFAMISRSSLIPMTGSAFTMPRTRLDVRVFFGVLMPLRTLGLRGLADRGVAARGDGIGNILGRSAPVEIFDNVVRGIIVLVTSLHTRRTGTDEGLQHKDMDGYRPALTVPKQGDRIVAAAGLATAHFALGENLALQLLGGAPTASDFAVQGSDLRSGGYFVAGPFGYRQPTFSGHGYSVPLSFSPESAPLEGVSL